MAAVFAIGETVFDIIFRNGQPVAARAGGSMLNSAVSLGRCGVTVEMITEIGDDIVGKLILDFLGENGVCTSLIKPVPGFQTPVSLAFLDEQGNAYYSFYKKYPDERLNITWPGVKRGDVVLFGSFYSLGQSIRERIVTFLRNAKQEGAIIIYDPNIRKNHLAEIRKLMHHVEENIDLADIVRGSDEDFKNLFGELETSRIYNRIRQAGCGNLVITRGKSGVEFVSDRLNIHVTVPDIKVVSTIGAGDAFNAGIIFGINKKGISVNDLVNINRDEWQEILGYGINFAGDVCMSFDNYIQAGTYA